MNQFSLPHQLTLVCPDKYQSSCHEYACTELERLLKCLGLMVNTEHQKESDTFQLILFPSEQNRPELVPCPSGLQHDAYSICVSQTGVTLSTVSAKGLLNSVYDLAERLGFVFLLPGQDGEWAPKTPKALPLGDSIMTPRFPYRGLLWDPLNIHDFTTEEWLSFYAKLRFNAICHKAEDAALCEKLGLRLEVGAHGISKHLPRELFQEHPEYFRMFQPEDFNGKRMNDANICVSSQAGRKVIKENFSKQLIQPESVHAVHCWPDDLPGNGWCLCPSCRAFSPSDQALIAMGILAECVREQDSPLRFSLLAYHDTMMPGTQAVAPPEGFLFFAPRERCYGHALDDETCERNRFYFAALKAWQEKCRDLDESHSFEYYFDQILFRGMYPFLPQIIIDDMKVYQEHGIQCHMALKVAGPAFAPEYNMLVLARSMWDEELDAESFIRYMSTSICPDDPEPWQRFLQIRADVFKKAMRMCGHDPDIYLDYRWLPETISSFGQEMVKVYEDTSIALSEAAASLEHSICQAWPERVRALADKEVKRAYFEAAELKVMSLQQQTGNELARFLVYGEDTHRERGCDALRKTIEALKTAYQKALETGMPEDTWYFKAVNQWLSREMQDKLENYAPTN